MCLQLAEEENEQRRRQEQMLLEKLEQEEQQEEEEETRVKLHDIIHYLAPIMSAGCDLLMEEELMLAPPC